jgi:hypothetical protein
MLPRPSHPRRSLFQLYVCTHDILHHYRTTDKFIAIKAVLGIAVLQDMIIKVVVKKFIKPGYFTDEMKSEFWADFALTVEAIILALAHKNAYPVGELADSTGSFAAKRAAAKAHALEMIALPRGPHGEVDASGDSPHDEEAPRVEVIELNPAGAYGDDEGAGGDGDADGAREGEPTREEEEEEEEAWPERYAGQPALAAPPPVSARMTPSVAAASPRPSPAPSPAPSRGARAPAAPAGAPAPAPAAARRGPAPLPAPPPRPAPAAAPGDESDWTETDADAASQSDVSEAPSRRGGGGGGGRAPAAAQAKRG